MMIPVSFFQTLSTADKLRSNICTYVSSRKVRRGYCL